MAQAPAAARVGTMDTLAAEERSASDLHGGLVGGAVAAGTAWIAVSSVLLDWAWDGTVLGLALSRGAAAWLAFAAGGLAVAVVGAMLGAIVDRRIVRAAFIAALAGQAAALALAAALTGAFALGFDLAPRVASVSIGSAIALACASTAAVLMVPRRREA